MTAAQDSHPKEDRSRLRAFWLGRRSYVPTYELQVRLLEARSAGAIPDTVLFLEHSPVVTLGRRADPKNVLLGEDALRARGFDRVETDRGGDVTLHAPGQLVAYPILDLSPDRRDVRKYVKDLLETMRRLAADLGVHGGEVPDKIGLWADPENPAAFPGADAPGLVKIGAIGVRISRWITMHGFALNLTASPDLFRIIVPCGIQDYGVSSIRELAGSAPEPAEAAPSAFRHLAAVFSRDAEPLVDLSGVEDPAGEILGRAGAEVAQTREV